MTAHIRGKLVKYMSRTGLVPTDKSGHMKDEADAPISLLYFLRHKEQGFLNPYFSLKDRNGHMTNKSGHMINKSGHMTNKSGHMINKSGHMTNKMENVPFLWSWLVG